MKKCNEDESEWHQIMVQFRDFSFEEFFVILNKLGLDVHITIRPKHENSKALLYLTIDEDLTKASILRGINDIKEGRVSKIKIKKEKPNVNRRNKTTKP